MKKEITVPNGVNIEIEESSVKVSGPKGQLKRTFYHFFDITIKKENDKVMVSSDSDRRKVKAMVGTIAAHIRNMIIGVTKGFTYKLRIIYSHFPVNVKIQGEDVQIHNFLGERVPRTTKVIEGVDVEVKGQDIYIRGIDLEKVGIMANRLEQITRITGKDRRVFEDGIFIVEREKR